MNKINLFLLLFLLSTFLTSAQNPEKLLTMDNYLIPMGKKGYKIGKVIATNKDKVSIVKDTAGLFTIDKEGYICLKKGKMLYSGSPICYEIKIKNGNETKAFELVKDEFIHNKVIAHRGAWKAKDYSHNSMSALKHAIKIGCEGSELDIWMSSDNVVILSHDNIISGKKVEETTADELSKIALKQGDFVPTLEEYISCIKKQNRTKLVIEIKGTHKGKPIADSVVQIVHRMKAQAWVDYISFGLEYLIRTKEIDPTAKAAYLGSDKSLEELKSAGMAGIDFHYSMFLKDKELANKAKAMGLSTNVWTVNDEDTLKSMLGQNIDYITTDEPELLLRLIE